MYPEIFRFWPLTKRLKSTYEDPKDSNFFLRLPSWYFNSRYFFRSELRETMVVGDKKYNWIFRQGGNHEVRYWQGFQRARRKIQPYNYSSNSMVDCQMNNVDFNRSKTITLLHILKIYWDNGKIRVKPSWKPKRKSSELLPQRCLIDDEGRNFKEKSWFNCRH
jgi:hypothetical protein